MRRLGWFLLALAACKSDPKDYMVGGGGGGGGGGAVDAAGSGSGSAIKDAPSAIDANLFSGRVCLTSDPRTLTDASTCPSTGVGGLTVRLGAHVTTTADDGTFSIVGDPAAQPVWRVTGSNIVSSFEPLGYYYVPALTTTGYANLLSANGVLLVQGEGSIIALEFSNGVGTTGVTAAANPLSRYEGFYSAASGWTQTATDAHGIAWLPGINVGTASVTSNIGMTASVTVSNVPVFDGGVTFIESVFP
ncbi:MAG: hypothetical protein JO257_01115 [Deltaproteobacteria bacterium]|nr:hypothetical protein [Deltaproteobacteria bacterium]